MAHKSITKKKRKKALKAKTKLRLLGKQSTKIRR